MKRQVREWIEKAEGQFNAASFIRRHRKRTSHDAICFWSHECAACYAKARLVQANIGFPITCDFASVFARVTSVEPLRTSMSKRLEELSFYDESVMYPGRRCTGREAARAFETCSRYRSLVRSSLGLES